MIDQAEGAARFTLDLSMLGIRLLYDLNGVPTVLGDVSVTAPDLDRRMASLRQRALRLAEPPIRTNVFVPSDHVLYRTAQSEIVTARLRQVLEEDVQQEAMRRTERQHPDEICVVSAQVGSQCFIAAIERSVLREASDFARHHGFEPAILTSHVPKGLYPTPPIFPDPTSRAGQEQRATERESPGQDADGHGHMIAQINDLQSTLADVRAQIDTLDDQSF